MSFKKRTIEANLSDLTDMLLTCRPASSRAERAFIARWITPLGVEQDSKGNLIKRIGDDPILWSSHTDTVHWKDGVQRIEVAEDGFLTLEIRT